MVGALHACRVFGPDNRGALAHKATGFSAKLLRKGDQCRAVLACSHLFWQAADGGGDSAAAADAGGPADAEVRPPVSSSSCAGTVCPAACACSSRRTGCIVASPLAGPKWSDCAADDPLKSGSFLVSHVTSVVSHRSLPSLPQQAQPAAEPEGDEGADVAQEEASDGAAPAAAAPEGAVLQPPVSR